MFSSPKDLKQKGKVLKLKKALHGLKQAPRAWYSRIDDHITQQGFEKSLSEHTIYVNKHKNGDILILYLYVDDLIIVGINKEYITKFKKKMIQEFEMTALEFLNYFLGIEVH